MLEELKATPEKEFEMTGLGFVKYFLGIEINLSAQGIFVFQQKYGSEILKKFRMDSCKPAHTPIAQEQS